MLAVVVTGLPGSGKTTLAGPLAAELGLSLISKDALKEQLSTRAEDRAIGRVAVELMYRLAAEHADVVLESFFWPGIAEADLIALDRRLIQVHCACPPSLAQQRFNARTDRHPVHHQDGDWWDHTTGLLDLPGRQLVVDTAAPVDVPALAEKVRRRPLLLVLNGPPGVGKSTLAARYVAGHPGATCVDLDVVRRGLPNWGDDAAGLAARAHGKEQAAAALKAGADVVLPQLLARAPFLDELEELAQQQDADFCELGLTADNAKERLLGRASHEVAEALIDKDGGYDVIAARLAELGTQRGTRSVDVSGDVETAFAQVMANLRREADAAVPSSGS